MSALAVFSFQEEHQVRVVMINGEPWFVASDVCMAAGIDSTAMLYPKYVSHANCIADIGLFAMPDQA
mgnify:CR=1 FL=1